MIQLHLFLPNGRTKPWYTNFWAYTMVESISEWFPIFGQNFQYVPPLAWATWLTLLQEITLTTSTDTFFQTHHLSTFGDLGTALKDYVQNYQSRSLASAPANIQSIADMKRFVEEYPEFRKLGGNVSKHVALVGELSRLVGRDKLLDVGEIEQGLATSSGVDYKVCLLAVQ